MLPKLEWIAQRTSFLDSTLDAWIDGLKASGGSPAEAQVVLLGAGRRHAPRREIAPADPRLRRGAGAGYDTRALRYSGDQAPAFYEVDLPVVTRAKGVLSSRYAAATGVRQPAMLPLDLMTCASGAHTLTAPSSLPQPPLCCHRPFREASLSRTPPRRRARARGARAARPRPQQAPLLPLLERRPRPLALAVATHETAHAQADAGHLRGGALLPLAARKGGAAARGGGPPRRGTPRCAEMHPRDVPRSRRDATCTSYTTRPRHVHDTSTTRPPTIPAAGHPASELALTDNLAPFLRSADRKDADDYFGGSLGLQLRQHETLWGGAIQFARAGAKSGE